MDKGPVSYTHLGLSWEDAWNATVKTMSYTNHTILQEALEKWDQQLFKRVLPRVYQIILEIDNRYVCLLYTSRCV